jgi:hypothetical protein
MGSLTLEIPTRFKVNTITKDMKVETAPQYAKNTPGIIALLMILLQLLSSK